VVIQRVYGGLSKRFDESHEGRDVVVVGGCIVAGTLTVGDRVVIQPSGVASVVVEAIESHHQPRRAVFGPHESVALKLRLRRRPSKHKEKSEEEEEVSPLRLIDLVGRGCVIGRSDQEPPKRVKSFSARVNVYNHPGFIRSGYTPTIRVHAATVACSFKLLDLVPITHFFCFFCHSL
jgi:translation elongation factor EF-1alpha